MMAMKKQQPTKKAAKQAKVTVDKQRKNNGENGGRDEKGRFAEGNPLGFQPGESGNPAGRPKSVTLSEAYRQQLAAQQAEGVESTYAEVIAKMVCDEAAKGNINAAGEIADREEGKQRQ